MGSIGKAIGKVVGGVGKALFGSPAKQSISPPANYISDPALDSYYGRFVAPTFLNPERGREFWDNYSRLLSAVFRDLNSPIVPWDRQAGYGSNSVGVGDLLALSVMKKYMLDTPLQSTLSYKQQGREPVVLTKGGSPGLLSPILGAIGVGVGSGLMQGIAKPIEGFVNSKLNNWLNPKPINLPEVKFSLPDYGLFR